MNDEVAALVGEAERSLQAASNLHEDSFYNYAVSRAYYAMFYIASALLLDRGLRYRHHGAVIANFGEKFVKSRMLPSELQEYLSRGFDLRSRGDYLVLEQITESESVKMLRQAREFVNAVKAFLEKESQV